MVFGYNPWSYNPWSLFDIPSLYLSAPYFWDALIYVALFVSLAVAVFKDHGTIGSGRPGKALAVVIGIALALIMVLFEALYLGRSIGDMAGGLAIIPVSLIAALLFFLVYKLLTGLFKIAAACAAPIAFILAFALVNAPFGQTLGELMAQWQPLAVFFTVGTWVAVVMIIVCVIKLILALFGGGGSVGNLFGGASDALSGHPKRSAERFKNKAEQERAKAEYEEAKRARKAAKNPGTDGKGKESEKRDDQGKEEKEERGEVEDDMLKAVGKFANGVNAFTSEVNELLNLLGAFLKSEGDARKRAAEAVEKQARDVGNDLVTLRSDAELLAKEKDQLQKLDKEQARKFGAFYATFFQAAVNLDKAWDDTVSAMEQTVPEREVLEMFVKVRKFVDLRKHTRAMLRWAKKTEDRIKKGSDEAGEAFIKQWLRIGEQANKLAWRSLSNVRKALKEAGKESEEHEEAKDGEAHAETGKPALEVKPLFKGKIERPDGIVEIDVKDDLEGQREFPIELIMHDAPHGARIAGPELHMTVDLQTIDHEKGESRALDAHVQQLIMRELRMNYGPLKDQPKEPGAERHVLVLGHGADKAFNAFKTLDELFFLRDGFFSDELILDLKYVLAHEGKSLAVAQLRIEIIRKSLPKKKELEKEKEELEREGEQQVTGQLGTGKERRTRQVQRWIADWGAKHSDDWLKEGTWVKLMGDMKKQKWLKKELHDIHGDDWKAVYDDQSLTDILERDFGMDQNAILQAYMATPAGARTYADDWLRKHKDATYGADAIINGFWKNFKDWKSIFEQVGVDDAWLKQRLEELQK